jgi:hypothetical protein
MKLFKFIRLKDFEDILSSKLESIGIRFNKENPISELSIENDEWTVLLNPEPQIINFEGAIL